jgi:hypothetical protein
MARVKVDVRYDEDYAEGSHAASVALDEPCPECMGFPPPEGVDPRTLDPLEFCNPDFCAYARCLKSREGKRKADQ